jgi:hypothetical protein
MRAEGIQLGGIYESLGEAFRVVAETSEYCDRDFVAFVKVDSAGQALSNPVLMDRAVFAERVQCRCPIPC